MAFLWKGSLCNVLGSNGTYHDKRLLSNFYRRRVVLRSIMKSFIIFEIIKTNQELVRIF